MLFLESHSFSKKVTKRGFWSKANHSSSVLGNIAQNIKRYNMLNIFASLKVYAGKWSLKALRNFSEEEINAISMAVVVPSEYGNSVQFIRKEGGMSYIPLSQDANVGIGEVIDLKAAKLITLEKQGEADIFRVEI
jgi:hypothetical protein